MNALIFLVKTLTDLYMLAFLLRFVMQWTRADFYNPLGRAVVEITNPLVRPARRLLPAARSIDLPTLVVLVLLQALATLLLLSIVGISLPVANFVVVVLLRLINLALWFYTIAILVYVVLSWVSPGGYSPVGALLGQIVEPLLRPVRRVVPLIGGLDLAPLLVLIGLQAVSIALPLQPAFLR